MNAHSLGDLIAVMRRLPWSSIKSLTGTSEGVPDAFERLFAPDEVSRNAAYWKLDNHVVVQGGLFEGAFYLVPFLISALKSINDVQADMCYELLYEIAIGQAAWNTQVSFKVSREAPWHFVPDADGIKVSLTIACRLAVALGIEVYGRHLSSADPRVQAKSIELVCSFTEHAAVLADLLRLQSDSIPKDVLMRAIRELTV